MKSYVRSCPAAAEWRQAANCKLQAVYDYKHGELAFLDVTAGTVPDNRYTDHLPDLLQKGDLLLIDQGYFKLSTLADIIAKGAFFLTRFLVRTLLKDAITQAPIDLAKYLRQVQSNACEMNVLMGDEKLSQVACRLIALRVSEQVANERRRRLKKEAKKKGRVVSKHHLQMCAWTLLITMFPNVGWLWKWSVRFTLFAGRLNCSSSNSSPSCASINLIPAKRIAYAVSYTAS